MVVIQQRSSTAAAELALKDPNLLFSRQSLLELPRAKVNEGYIFLKGKSRSKQCQSSGSTPKWPKTSGQRISANWKRT